MAPPVPTAAARLVLRRLLSTAVAEAEAAAVAPAAEKAAAKGAKTAAAAGEEKDARSLYRRLSALGGAGEGSVSRVMNKWVREGREARAADLAKYVKELRKYKRHAHALEVCAIVHHITFARRDAIFQERLAIENEVLPNFAPVGGIGVGNGLICMRIHLRLAATRTGTQQIELFW